MSIAKIQALEPGTLSALQEQVQAVLDANAKRAAAAEAARSTAAALSESSDALAQAQQAMDSAIISACDERITFVFGGFVFAPAQSGCYSITAVPPDLGTSQPGGAP